MFVKKFLKEESKTHWQAYKNLFQITVLRYLVTWFAIVPFFAILLSGLPSVFKIDILHTEIEYSFNLGLPFNWKLLWFSSLSFVIAYLLHLTLSPSFIRTYNSYRDYIAIMHSPRWIIWESQYIFKKKMDIDKFYERISTKKYTEDLTAEEFKKMEARYNEGKVDSEKFKDFGVLIEEEQTKLYFKHSNKFFSLGLPIIKDGAIDETQTSIVEKELFWEVFGRYSASYPIVKNDNIDFISC